MQQIAAEAGYEGVAAATSGNYGAAVASQAAKAGLKCIVVQEAFDSDIQLVFHVRVSRAGVFPLSWSLDHVGPLARSAASRCELPTAMMTWSTFSGSALRFG